jgi:hypothetical protein
MRKVTKKILFPILYYSPGALVMSDFRVCNVR